VIVPTIPTWAVKGGAFLIVVSAIFIAGCNTQKKMDAAKIDKLKAENRRQVEIIEVFQENYDVLDTALKDQNEAIAKLGEESIRRINSLKARHEEAVTRLARTNNEILESTRDEAAELRERLVRLSVAEACHEAMIALGE
jgi:hypothetical protein